MPAHEHAETRTETNCAAWAGFPPAQRTGAPQWKLPGREVPDPGVPNDPELKNHG